MSAQRLLSGGLLLADGSAGDFLSLLSRGLLSTVEDALAWTFEDRFLVEAQLADRLLTEAGFQAELALAEAEFPDLFLDEAILADRLLEEVSLQAELALAEVELGDRFLVEGLLRDAFTEAAETVDHFVTEIVFPDLFQEVP